jgi:hypothetical protein
MLLKILMIGILRVPSTQIPNFEAPAKVYNMRNVFTSHNNPVLVFKLCLILKSQICFPTVLAEILSA